MFSSFHSGSFGSSNGNNEWTPSPEEILEERQWRATRDPLGANKIQKARLETNRLDEIAKKAKKAADNAADNEATQSAYKQAYSAYRRAYNNEQQIVSRHYFNANQVEKKAIAAAEKARLNAPAASQKAYKLRDELQAAEKRRKEADDYVDELGLSNAEKKELKSKIMVILQERDTYRDERIKGLSTKKADAVSDAIYKTYFEKIVELLPPPIHRGGSRKRSARSKRTVHHTRKTYRRKSYRRKTYHNRK